MDTRPRPLRIIKKRIEQEEPVYFVEWEAEHYGGPTIKSWAHDDELFTSEVDLPIRFFRLYYSSLLQLLQLFSSVSLRPIRLNRWLQISIEKIMTRIYR